MPTDKDYDGFAGGITASRRPACYNPDGENPQPEYGDDWANRAFNIKGPDIDKIRGATHR